MPAWGVQLQPKNQQAEWTTLTALASVSVSVCVYCTVCVVRQWHDLSAGITYDVGWGSSKDAYGRRADRFNTPFLPQWALYFDVPYQSLACAPFAH